MTMRWLGLRRRSSPDTQTDGAEPDPQAIDAREERWRRRQELEAERRSNPHTDFPDTTYWQVP
jgi:hypothetical protein